MGMKQLPKRSGEYLFEIIMRRYETRSTMMTSNRPLEDWGKLIGDVPSATAILDEAAGTLVRSMTKCIGVITRDRPDETTLDALGEAIVVVISDLRPTRTARTATTGVAALADRTNWPLALAVLTLVKNPPCRLSNEQLVNLLKDPLCVGKARRLILDQLEIRYQRKFADQWAFARFAQSELHIDPTGPPTPR
jgi:hypothetical protein